MNISAASHALIEALKARGVIAADIPAPETETVHRPWFIALMLGIAGWLAGILLLAFAATFLDLKSSSAFVLVGIMLMGGAWMLYYADRDAVFLDQLALALSIAGQFSLAWGLLEHANSGLAVAATLLALQLAVLAIMPDRTARTLAALFATIAWVYVVRFAVRGGGSEDLLGEFDGYRNHPGDWSIVPAWLLTWVPMMWAAAWLTLREQVWMPHRFRPLARPVLTGLLLGLCVGGLATEPFIKLAFGVDALGVPMSWMAVFPLLSIGLALFAAWCAFQLRSFGVLGFAIFAALMHLSRFYYLYGTSLTWKSMIMFCLGALMLGAGVLVQKRHDGSGA